MSPADHPLRALRARRGLRASAGTAAPPGYLACVSAAGTVRVGDAIGVIGQRFERIPYAVRERLACYLNQRVEPIGTTELLREIGVPRSYARDLPAMLRTFPPPQRAKVLFRSDMR